MKGITRWVRRHQVAAFFTLAYLIAWPLFFLIYFVFPGSRLVMALGIPAVYRAADPSNIQI